MMDMTDTDAIQLWMEETGCELVREMPTKAELDEVWNRWNEMAENCKAMSDEKSIEMFGMSNATHYKVLSLVYV